MASNGIASHNLTGANLEHPEVALLELAADNPRDVLSLSEKEKAILRLYDQIQELELEQAVLEQELDIPTTTTTENIEDEVAKAEQELLELRATYTTRERAIETVLITDPILKAVHLKAATPAERALLPLVHRRDILALVQENLANAHSATLEALSKTEIQNIHANQQNQELTRQLLELTKQASSWRDELDDDEVKLRLDQVETDRKAIQGKWDVIKHVTAAAIVASGVDWARDDELRDLVLNGSD